MDWLYRSVSDVLSPSVSTLDFVELLWTAFALVGLTVSIRGFGDALADLRSVREFGDDARRIVAAGNIRHEIMRIFSKLKSWGSACLR